MITEHGFHTTTWGSALYGLKLDGETTARLDGLRQAGPRRMPGFVEVMAGFGTLVAAAFFVAAVFVADILDSESDAWVVGLPLWLVAGLVHRARPSDEAWGTRLLVAASLAGQALTIFGFFSTWGQIQAGLSLSLFYVAALLFVPGRFQAFVSAAALVLLSLAWMHDIHELLFGAVTVLSMALVAASRFLPDIGAAAPSADRRRAARHGAFWPLVALLALDARANYFGPEMSLLWPTLVLAATGIGALTAAHLRDPEQRSFHFWAAGLWVILAALCIEAPGILLACLVLGWGWWRRSLKTVATGAGLVLFFLFCFYYSLDVPLMQKAALAATTAVVLLLARVALRQGRGFTTKPVDGAGGNRHRAQKGLVFAATTCIALLVPAYWVQQQEAHLDRAEPMVLELAPVDPRSIMQGDYMRLAYHLERELSAESQGWPDSGRLVLRPDDDGVSRFVRLDDPDRPIEDGERLLQFQRKAGRVDIGFDTFLFEEGRGGDLAAARYAELRVDELGRGLLLNLLDEDQEPIVQADDKAPAP